MENNYNDRVMIKKTTKASTLKNFSKMKILNVNSSALTFTHGEYSQKWY